LTCFRVDISRNFKRNMREVISHLDATDCGVIIALLLIFWNSYISNFLAKPKYERILKIGKWTVRVTVTILAIWAVLSIIVGGN